MHIDVIRCKHLEVRECLGGLQLAEKPCVRWAGHVKVIVQNILINTT